MKIVRIVVAALVAIALFVPRRIRARVGAWRDRRRVLAHVTNRVGAPPCAPACQTCGIWKYGFEQMQRERDAANLRLELVRDAFHREVTDVRTRFFGEAFK